MKQGEVKLIKKLKIKYVNLCFNLFPEHRLKKSGAKIGENIFFGNNIYVELENADLLAIEDNVVLSAFSKIILHDSSLNNIEEFDILYGKVILKKNCYIGVNTTILPGSIIGENTIVGANSLVKGMLKDNSVYFGQPARYYCSIKELKKNWIRKKASLKHNSLHIFKKSRRFYEKDE